MKLSFAAVTFSVLTMLPAVCAAGPAKKPLGAHPCIASVGLGAWLNALPTNVVRADQWLSWTDPTTNQTTTANSSIDLERVNIGTFTLMGTTGGKLTNISTSSLTLSPAPTLRLFAAVWAVLTNDYAHSKVTMGTAVPAEISQTGSNPDFTEDEKYATFEVVNLLSGDKVEKSGIFTATTTR